MRRIARYENPDLVRSLIGEKRKVAFFEVGDAAANIKRHVKDFADNSFYDNVLEGVPAIAGRAAQPLVAGIKTVGSAALMAPLIPLKVIGRSFLNVGKGLAGRVAGTGAPLSLKGIASGALNMTKKHPMLVGMAGLGAMGAPELRPGEYTERANQLAWRMAGQTPPPAQSVTEAM